MSSGHAGLVIEGSECSQPRGMNAVKQNSLRCRLHSEYLHVHGYSAHIIRLSLVSISSLSFSESHLNVTNANKIVYFSSAVNHGFGT
jgi:hypothetical protein